MVFGGFVSDNLLPFRELLLFNSDDFFDDKLSFSSNLSKNEKLIGLNWHINRKVFMTVEQIEAFCNLNFNGYVKFKF